MFLLLWTDDNRSKALYSVLGISFLWGFLIEVIGVNTGVIFGSYSYGPFLGPKILDTPLLIGMNWAMLLYATACTINILIKKSPHILKAVLIALFVTGLDYLIEPGAIKMQYWTWSEVAPPLQNYIAWFLIALPLAGLFQYKLPNLKNKTGLTLFIVQAVFFLCLG